jgi:P-type E1-E2 ATPase
VGDIVLLNAGDKVPADGILVDGSDVTCDESSLTGESDDKKKTTADSGDIFLLSGTSLSTGYAHMLITAVGTQSRWGKTKAKLALESADTPLQEKLDTLANQIGNFGMVSAGITFVAMIFIRYIHPDNQVSWYEYVLRAFIMSVTVNSSFIPLCAVN